MRHVGAAGLVPGHDAPMAEPTRTDTVTVPDGQFDLHVWLPERGTGPAMLLVQEIFGVGDYIKAVAGRLTDLGYVVGAPDVFWRIERNWAAGHDEAGLTASLATVSKFDAEQGVTDCVAAFHRLGGLPEVAGGAGVIGFCLGGSLAWAVAARTDPDAVVSYYGSMVPSMAHLAARVTAPCLLHFGRADAYIPAEEVAKVEAAIEGRPHLRVEWHPAGHAFDNHESAMFYDEAAAAVAWSQTVDFLRQHLPTQ
jgi:carboxymethylenebutenolidase